MNIKFVDLPRQNKYLKKELMPTIEKIIDDGDFTMGSYVEKFETAFAQFCNKKYAVGLNSGTDAIRLALQAYGITEGDEVITAVNGYFSVAAMISELGAIPVFVDVDPNTYTMDTEKLQESITKRTRAIIPVHLYGQPANMEVILTIANQHKLIVIEDACQAHGAAYKGKVVPVGETGAFSFYPGKNLGCFGDGGALVTDNKDIWEKAMYLRNDGSLKKYIHPMFGIKSRLDAIQAAVLSIKLPYLNEWNEKRRQHATLYTKILKDIPQIKTPQEAQNVTHAYHLYVIECQKRDELKTYLEEKGIEVGIHYPIPIHLQEVYREKGYKEGDFPVAEEKAHFLLSLPMFPELTEKEIVYVCKSIQDFY